MNSVLSVSEIKSAPLKLNIRDISVGILQTGPEENPVFDRIAAESGEFTLNYIKWLGLTNTKEVMILSSFDHYYDSVDFTGIKSLIILRMLNHIRHLDSFLYILSRKVSEYCGFVGFFRDDGANEDHLQTKHFGINAFTRQKNMVKPAVDTILSRQDVLILLQKNGFKIKDLTIICNIVFFYSEVLTTTQ